MSAVLEQTTGTVIPDSIEPIEQWRAWRFDGKYLQSLNNRAKWTPGEPFKASCAATADYVHKWVAERDAPLAAPPTFVASYPGYYAMTAVSAVSSYAMPVAPPEPEQPKLILPRPYEWKLRWVPPHLHDAPSEFCTCGIYAVDDIDDCPGGDIFGKVKLWGTVIPGTNGTRAQYAYPSELHVPADMAENPALLAYGVPIVVREAKEMQDIFPDLLRRPKGMPWHLKFAIGFNVAAGLLNLGLIAFRSWA